MKPNLLVIFLGLFLIASCGDKEENKPEVTTNPNVTASKWSKEDIFNLIACNPEMEGSIKGKKLGKEACDCINTGITQNYTPEQVKQKSPFVVREMENIRYKCEKNSSSYNEPITSTSGIMPSIKEATCETGDHKFSSFNELCIILQDDSLNNNCAKDARRKFFDELKCATLTN